MRHTRAYFFSIALLLSVMLALAGPSPVHGSASTVCRVKWNVGGTTHDGQSWETAYPSLQTALLDPTNCTEIWVAAGAYKPGTLVTDTFIVHSGTSVYGGFAGTELVRDSRDPGVNIAILSGDIDNNDDSSNSDGNYIDETYAEITGNNAHRVVGMGGSGDPQVGSSTRLDGFTITGGAADGSGGGLYCDAGTSGECSPVLTNLVFIGNRAEESGGAVALWGQNGGTSNPSFISVTFAANYATTAGGAVYSNASTGTSSPGYTNVTFTDNLSDGNGGAVYNYGYHGTSSPTFTNVEFTNNHAAMGGAIYNGGVWSAVGHPSESSPFFYNAVFNNNAGSVGGAVFNNGDGGNSNPFFMFVAFNDNTASGNGGAVYNSGRDAGTSSPTFQNAIFHHNVANAEGGAVFDDATIGGTSTGHTDPSFFNVTFDSNSAGHGGGAVYNDAYGGGHASLTFANSTFYHNSTVTTSPYGNGGAYVNDAGDSGNAQASFINVTFYDNHSANRGGAIYNSGGSGYSAAALTNVILWGDTAVAGDPEMRNDDDMSGLSYSVVQGGCAGLTNVFCTAGNISANPNLDTLASNGGFAQTLALTASSSAVDTGSNAACVSSPISDLDERGFSRPSDGNSDGSAVCDIGAYEYGGSIPYQIRVLIAGEQWGNHLLGRWGAARADYSPINNGPVVVRNTSAPDLVTSERVAYTPDGGATWTSYGELMGLPASLLTDTYYFPWYNSINLSSQVSVGNVGTSSTTITITIGGNVVDTYTLAASASKRVKYNGLNTGPVVVHSSGSVPIIASERISYTPNGINYTSYSELMGLPASQLTDTYYFSYYNSLNLSEQVSVANVGSSSTTVTVTIGGNVVDSYILGASASKRVKYPGLNTGPVVVHSTGGVPIIASERISFTPDAGVTYTGYSEMMGLPSAQLTDTYAFPWYNSVDHSMQVSAANVGSGSTTVTVTIGGAVVDSYNLDPNSSKRVKYLGVTNGPVVVHSSGGVHIIASERTSYTPDAGVTYPSFSEMLGLPSSLITDSYYFPWYNGLNLNTEVRFGVP